MSQKPPSRKNRQRKNRGRVIALVVAGIMALSLAAYYFQAAGPAAGPAGSTGVPESAERFIQEGNRAYDAGDYSAAIRWYERALPWRGQDPGVLTDLGTAYFYRQPPDPRRAIEYYDRALAVDPSFANALFNKGIVLWQGLGDPGAAVAVWKKLLAALPPGDPMTLKVQQSLAAVQEAVGQTGKPTGSQPPSAGPPAGSAPPPGSRLSSGFGR